MKSHGNHRSSPDDASQIDKVCDDFEEKWQAGQAPRIKDYLDDCPAHARNFLLHELIAIDARYRAKNGDLWSQTDYEREFPELKEAIALAFMSIATHTKDFATTRYEAEGEIESAETVPNQIDRYQILKLLGKGGFGSVYLAHDPNLNRNVAIKVPRAELSVRPDYVRDFLLEAEILAKLDHPNIVRVHDARQSGDGRCFLVSEWIQGTDLKKLMAQHRLSWRDAAELVAKVADALQHAHSLKLVHRDIKPANILIDESREPHVADFGLALRDEEFGRGGEFAGTPAYMSPEQARGEGHLVDGRSDIYSLSVVLYELLTGERPFSASSRRELLERIKYLEPRPPRQLLGDIPSALERICLKALSKQATDRYTAAVDMAEDLRGFLEGSQTAESREVVLPAAKVIPKGLRSFDEMDADFFLRLLPGPRDRDGVPASLRFWKSRIEEKDPDRTFRIGVIYGPSGCGKSSMVKAGLLPLLPSFVESVFVEANGLDDEKRLLRAIRKKYGSIDADMDLVEAISGLRRGLFSPPGRKTLLVLDQFEQWLHSTQGRNDAELIAALRHCDGERVQCLVLVRDDFWMAITRFMRQLEEPIVEGRNSAAVDLFDLPHGRRVLAEFGRSFGRLPEGPQSLTKEQESFLEQAVRELARNDKIIPVRLALFADMVKGKPWTSATMKEYGGAQGITLTFLEETFSAETAPIEHRVHQKAARSVLASLLPESSVSIKGHMRSHGELLQASAYTHRPDEFATLMRILDNETRLLTPVELESGESGPAFQTSEAHVEHTAHEKYYHLTHDYLVQPLREWLTRKQRETRRGRAELRLEERTSLWNSKPEKRRLPALWEDLGFRFLTRKKNWSEPQRRMMRDSGIYYTVRASVIVLLVALLAWGSSEINGRQRARALIEKLAEARTTEVPQIVGQLSRYRQWIDPLLRKMHAESTPNTREHLHSAMAMLPVDASFTSRISEGLFSVPAADFGTLLHWLVQNPESARIGVPTLNDDLWNDLANHSVESERSFRAGVALATLEPSRFEGTSTEGAAVRVFLADRLLTEVLTFASHYETWVGALRPVRSHLIEPLGRTFRDDSAPDAERRMAATILAIYAADRPREIANLLLEATPAQHEILTVTVDWLNEPQILQLLLDVVRTSIPLDSDRDSQNRGLKRRAHARALLLLLDQPEFVWSTLSRSDDPTERTYLIRRLADLSTKPKQLLAKLQVVDDSSVRTALLQILGGMDRTRLAANVQQVATSSFKDAFEHDSSGVHSAAAWALRKWGQENVIEMDSKGLTSKEPVSEREWYINSEGHTFAVFHRPIIARIGSPPEEQGDSDEGQAVRRINRDIAVATKEVTNKQFLRFMPDFEHKFNEFSPTEDSPFAGLTWHRAVQYCVWLSLREGIREDQICYRSKDPDLVIRDATDVHRAGEMEPYPNYLHRTGYRLPTDAEWEYVCRAGTTTPYCWGNDPAMADSYACHIGISGGLNLPVGTLLPNDRGLFDMHGNVEEWIHDYYIEERSPTEGDDSEVLMANDPSRIIRGGTSTGSVVSLRSANRRVGPVTETSLRLGFRVARTLDSWD